MARGLDRIVVLLGDRAALALEDEGIAPDRDDGSTVDVSGRDAFSRAHGTLSGVTVCASCRSASSKQPNGARAMPAPIWPTPASRCAMPVLITGAMPVS